MSTRPGWSATRARSLPPATIPLPRPPLPHQHYQRAIVVDRLLQVRALEKNHVTTTRPTRVRQSPTTPSSTESPSPCAGPEKRSPRIPPNPAGKRPATFHSTSTGGTRARRVVMNTKATREGRVILIPTGTAKSGETLQTGNP